MKQKVINLNDMARRLALKSSLNIQDMERLFKQLMLEIESSLSKGEKIKFGKLFILAPKQVKSHTHYDPVNDTYIQLNDKVSYKLIKLKKFKNIEKKH